MSKVKKQLRGFALLPPERRRELAIMGGKAQGKAVNPANFAHNIKRAKEAGRKGGLKKRVH